MIQIVLVSQHIVSLWTVECLSACFKGTSDVSDTWIILRCTWQVLLVNVQINHLILRWDLSVVVYENHPALSLCLICCLKAPLRQNFLAFPCSPSPCLKGSPVELVRNSQRGQMCMLSDYVMIEQEGDWEVQGWKEEVLACFIALTKEGRTRL